MSTQSSALRLAAVFAAVAIGAAVAAPIAQAKSAGPLITPAALSSNFKTPLDSTPNPDGNMIYFTASASKGSGKGVFAVAAKGGKATALFVGAPFMTPAGIATSLDGQQVFVADAQANQLFALSIAGKATPLPIKGTQGTAPRNLDVVSEHDQMTIYFTGKDADGQPAVLKIAASGADKAQVVFKGAPLAEPDGIAVSADSTVYVADRMAGKVFKIAGGKASELVSNVHTGNPAGIALTKDGSTLLVSAFQADGKHDQVLVVNTATGASSSVTDVVGKNSAAGGVHRAYNMNVFSWADLTSPGCRARGCVYRVNP